MLRKDSPEPEISCQLGISWLDDSEDTRKRSWERVNSLRYPDSEESEDDRVDTDESEYGLVLMNLRDEVMHPITIDTCGERCAQLDDFSWIRPTEEWNEESDMPESEIDKSHIRDGVCWNTSDSSSPETGTTRQQGSGAPVVAQTRPRGDSQTAMPPAKTPATECPNDGQYFSDGHQSGVCRSMYKGF